MKNFLSKALIIAVFFGSLYGCAFSKENVRINHLPPNYSISVQSDKTIMLDKLRDVRGVDPKLISYKGVQGRTSGGYINDIEIAELLTNLLKNLLVDLGYHIVDNEGDITLTGEVIKFDSYVIMGFWSGEIEAALQLNLKLVNTITSNIIWNETIGGHGKKSGVQIDHWENRKEAIDKALDQLLRNIANSPSFKNAINKN
jgi:hypothetical protein